MDESNIPTTFGNLAFSDADNNLNHFQPVPTCGTTCACPCHQFWCNMLSPKCWCHCHIKIHEIGDFKRNKIT